MGVLGLPEPPVPYMDPALDADLLEGGLLAVSFVLLRKPPESGLKGASFTPDPGVVAPSGREVWEGADPGRENGSLDGLLYTACMDHVGYC